MSHIVRSVFCLRRRRHTWLACPTTASASRDHLLCPQDGSTCNSDQVWHWDISTYSESNASIFFALTLFFFSKGI